MAEQRAVAADDRAQERGAAQFSGTAQGRSPADHQLRGARGEG